MSSSGVGSANPIKIHYSLHNRPGRVNLHNRLNRLNRLAYRNRHGSNHRGSRRDSSRGNNREDSFLLLHPGNRPRKGISMLRPGALRQDGIIPHAGVRVVDLAV